jgi:hypothetical protein
MNPASHTDAGRTSPQQQQTPDTCEVTSYPPTPKKSLPTHWDLWQTQTRLIELLAPNPAVQKCHLAVARDLVMFGREGPRLPR